MRHRLFDTFTGLFVLVRRDDGGVRTTWMGPEADLKDSVLDPRLLPDLSKRIRMYFDGEDVDFGDVELPEAGEFHRRCWKACRRIPRGQTISYAELARRAGSAAAARAAGQAMRKNPLPIITPCHRVIATSGRLHGFGGSCDSSCPMLGVKKRLLEMEAGSPVSA